MNGYLEIKENDKIIKEITFSDFEIDYRLKTIKIKNSFTEFLYPFSDIKEYFDLNCFFHIVITL